MFEKTKVNEKEAGVGPFLKTMLKTERGTFHKSNMGKQKNREASLKMDGAPNIVARFGLKQK